jgi:hypothetical protein
LYQVVKGVAERITLVFLIDALGWEIVREYGFCDSLLPRRSPLGTVLGYSSAAIPSLLSGSTPAEHGSWAMYRRSGARSPFGFLRALPPLPHALDWRVRRLTRRLTDRRGVIRGYYDLYDIPVHVLGHFDVAQHQDPYQPGGLSRETVFDAFVAAGVSYRLWYYRTPEERNMEEVIAALGGGESVLFLYTAELDALMHRVGVFEDAVASRLARYQTFLEQVMETAQARGVSVDIHVLSDHGMTPVDRSVDLWGTLERGGYRLGSDYLAFYDSTMARLWCEDDVLAAAVGHLEETGSGRLLSAAELEEFGCDFPDDRYGQHVLLAHPGVMVVPSFMGRERIAAMHGYDPGDRFSKGVFLTNDTAGQLPESILDFKRYLVERTVEAQ